MHNSDDTRYSIDLPQTELPLSHHSLPRNTILRHGEAEDEGATFEVMRRAMGFEMRKEMHSAIRDHLRQSPGCSFWVAEETPRFARPRIVGYARSIIRDRVLCITEFFVLPDHHQRGLGQSLLEHCLADAEHIGIEARMVLASQHTGANSLYIRQLGCAPRLPMFLLAGSPNQLQLPREQQGTVFDLHFTEPVRSGNPNLLFAEPIQLNAEIRATLQELDHTIVGFSRLPEHEFWCREVERGEGVARLFRRGSETGEIVGYAYTGVAFQGPLLAQSPEDLPRILHHTTQLFAHKNRLRDFSPLPQGFDSYCAVAGVCAPTLKWLLECGWQIIFQYQMLSSCPLGQPDRYIGHNPLYVL